MTDTVCIAAAKSVFREYVEASPRPDAAAADAFFAEGAAINVVHPFNEMTVVGYARDFIAPLQAAFAHLIRTDYVVFAGAFEGGVWATSTGYYTGHFGAPWLGIAPTGTLAHLRFGEFHRIENGQAVESYIYLDIPELMIAAGQWPISESPGRDRGYTGYLAGPVPQDGLQWQENDAERSASSYQMVTQMLRSLATKDEAWRPYWHDDMIWYGPAAFGSFIGIENFAGFQVPFESAFSEWIGGSVKGSETRHFARFADGNYIASGGWPSLNMIQAKPFLGQPVTDKRLYMRVCDWWRREGDKLMENWVFVDIPHVLLQMGFDVFAPKKTGMS
ncbi:MAG: hypothetical protein HKN27_14175 [Silicimonas sp.]|nr:hypothetical protein [Silicimonas sp.]